MNLFDAGRIRVIALVAVALLAPGHAPFAGTWTGTRSVPAPDGGSHAEQITIVLDADSAGVRYSGYLILPNGAHAPFRKTELVDGSITWQMPNSGGGSWHYAARLVAKDSVAGTLVLKDWPQGGGGEPAGTFALGRHAPSK